MSNKKKMKKMYKNFMRMFPGMMPPASFMQNMGAFGWPGMNNFESNMEAFWEQMIDMQKSNMEAFVEQMAVLQKSSMKAASKDWSKFFKKMMNS